MNLKKYKSITPGSRGHININYKKENLSKENPIKRLVKGLKKTGGRNNKGQISSYHRGGGHKRLYREIDFKRSIRDITGYIIRIEYDPNRSSYISLVAFSNGILKYMLTPTGLKEHDTIISSTNKNTPIKIGNSLPLKNIPVGTIIHNIEIKLNKGGQYARSAGTYGKIIRKENGKSLIRLNSNREIEISSDCFCTIGALSNKNYTNIKIGKAGRSRWLNWKPIVRGVAMNPVDHPHGGGEGKTSGGRCSVTPWGIPTKGYKTKRKKKDIKIKKR
jgi:large subunit ribosomal protein L2